jgi:indolepyruvate ferredoxin oxidoreductase alpha subunit
MGQATQAVALEDVARSLGIPQVMTVDAYDVKGVEKALRECLDTTGPAVIVARRECALLPDVRKQWLALSINQERCNGCGLCFQIGCPAVIQSNEVDAKSGRHKAQIDVLLCTGCEICAQVCARKAILFRDEVICDA